MEKLITEASDLELELDMLDLRQELCGLEFERQRRSIMSAFKQTKKEKNPKSRGKIKKY